MSNDQNDLLDDNEEPGAVLHHNQPLQMGGKLAHELALPPLPRINWEQARQPRLPGPPPYRHSPLLPTSVLELVVPGATDYLAPPDKDDNLELDAPPPAMMAALGAAGRAILGESEGELPELVLDGIDFDALFAYLIYMALGLGTLYLGIGLRYGVLAAVMVIAGALFVLVNREAEPVLLINLGWGVSIGLVFSLPLLILTGPGLGETARTVFPFTEPSAALYLLVFVLPLGETLFFRGFIQRERGFGMAVGAAALANLLLYWPAGVSRPVYLAVIAVFSAVLASIYSFVQMRNGLAAALVCQVVANVVLLLLPMLLFGG